MKEEGIIGDAKEKDNRLLQLLKSNYKYEHIYKRWAVAS